MSTPVVSIVPVRAERDARTAVLEAVEEAMELAHWRQHVPRGVAVALKPNLGWDLFLPGAITGPWVIEGVVRMLRGWADPMYLVESDQVVVHVDRAFRYNHLGALCERYGVRWVNMTHLPLVRVPVPRPRVLPELWVPELLRDTVLVTLPVMKTHNKTTITGAIKNQWGCLPMFRHQYHLVLDAALADINQVARPVFAVMDATVALEGDSPKSGIPRVVDRVLASSDAVALDAVAARMMGFDPGSIGHLLECHAAGLGQCRLDHINVQGEPLDEIQLRFRPAHHNLVSWAELVLRKRPWLRPLVFETPVFRLCCWLTTAYYDAWYSLLGIGRRRRDRILHHTRYGAQWAAPPAGSSDPAN